MNLMRRMLSLVLVFAMVATLLVATASASDGGFTDGDFIVNTDAVYGLSNLGILEGNGDGSFDPEGYVSRAQMAKMICLIIMGGDEPTGFTHEFTDIDGHWAEQYIAYCAYKGIITGYKDGTFAPSELVTGYEAAKMMLVAMGYTAEKEGLIGDDWKENTKNLATSEEINLFAGSSIDYDFPMTRDYAALLVFNGLNAQTVQYNASGNKVYGDTMLAKYFEVVLVEGVVVANEYSDMAGNFLESGQTTVAVTAIDGNTESFRGYRSLSTFQMSTDLGDLGRSISFYATGYELVGSIRLTGDDQMVTLYGDGISDLATLAQGYSWTDAVLVDFSEEPSVTENTVLQVGDYAQLVVVDHEITYAFYYCYTFGQVSRCDETRLVVDGWVYDLERDMVVGYEGLEVGDYVNYFTLGEDSIWMTPTKVVNALYTRYSGDADGITAMTVGGVVYPVSTVSGASAVTISLNLNQMVTLYLDALGNVALTEGEVTETSGQYAYIMTAGVDVKTDPESELAVSTPKVYVTLDNGHIDTYDVLTLNGISYGTVGFEEADLFARIGTICEYSVNEEEGTIVLVTLSQVETVLDTQVDKGSETVVYDQTEVVYANQETVYFYVDDQKDVSVYVGYEEAPTNFVDVSRMVVTTDDQGNSQLQVVLMDQGLEPGESFNGNWMYIYDVVECSDTVAYVDAVVNGFTLKNILITDVTVEVGFYQFTMEGNVYSVESMTTSGAQIHLIGSSSMVLIGVIIEEIKVDSSALVFDLTDLSQVAVVRDGLEKGEYILYFTDSSEVIRAIAITTQEVVDAINQQ